MRQPALSAPTGRALMAVVQTARENAEMRHTVNAVFEQRLANVVRRLDVAAKRGELPPVDGYFFAEILTAPVHLHITRAYRPFTRAVAEQITDVVLAGLHATCWTSGPS